MDDFSKIIKEMNKDLTERKRLFDSIQPMFIELILIGISPRFFDPPCSDKDFLKACGIKDI